MCVKLQAPQNAQRAPGLPYGWKFTFVDPKKDHPLMKSFQGLRLVAPMGQTFRSLESASSVSDFSCSNAEVFHEFVGLTDVVDVEKNPKVVSDKKEVSEACYALFTNGCYYLGTIEKVSGKGDYRTFDVRFDDGDFLAGVANNQVYTENDYVSVNLQ